MHISTRLSNVEHVEHFLSINRTFQKCNDVGIIPQTFSPLLVEPCRLQRRAGRCRCEPSELRTSSPCRGEFPLQDTSTRKGAASSASWNVSLQEKSFVIDVWTQCILIFPTTVTPKGGGKYSSVNLYFYRATEVHHYSQRLCVLLQEQYLTCTTGGILS